jgi:hypothetical protein
VRHPHLLWALWTSSGTKSTRNDLGLTVGLAYHLRQATPSGRGGKHVRDSATHPLAPLGEILTTSRHFADCATGAAVLWCISNGTAR